jgi:hypothetical protein
LNRYITAKADFIFYAKVSDYIINTGIERNNLNYVTEINYNIPYHYYDLWQNALLAKFFQLNYLATLTNITYNLNFIIVFLGILVFIESILISYNKQFNYSKIFLLTTLVFFSTMFYHPFLRIYLYPILLKFIKADVLFLDIFGYPKLFPIYITCIFIYLSIIFKNHGLFFSSLILCGLLYPITMPMFYSISFLIILFDYFLIKKLKNHLNYLVLLMLSAMFYIIFYKFTYNNIKNDTFFSSILQINRADLIIKFRIPFATIFTLLVLFFPYLLLLKSKILFDKFYLRNSFYFMIAALAISVTVWAVVDKAPNSFQLYSNAFSPVLHVFLYLSVLTVYLFADKKWIYITTLILLANVLLNARRIFFDNATHKIFLDKLSKNDKDFVLKVAKAVEQKNRLGAFILNPEFYLNNKMNSFHKFYYVYNPALFLSYFDTKYHAISLSIFDTKYDSTSYFFQTEKLLVENSEFYQFVETQKKNHQFKSILQSQLDFIKKYHIEWLVTDSETILPDEIKKLVVQEFSSEDRIKFYLLNPSKSN